MSFILKIPVQEGVGPDSPTLKQQNVRPALTGESKKRYVPPLIGVAMIKLESSLAAGSVSRVQIGSPGDANTPEVEDWALDGTNNQINL